MSDEPKEILASWKPLLTAAVDFAEEFPERYRAQIFEAVVKKLLDRRSETRTEREAEPEAPEPGSTSRGLRRVADAVGIETSALRRVISIDAEEETVRILAPRVGGSNTSERQNLFSAVYCFAREKGLGKDKTDIEELRALCKDRGCYDMDNFTGNFRTQDLLREIPEEESGGRKYLLSNQGVKTAKKVLQQLVESEP